MKVNLVKYNTFILCVYLNFFIVMTFLTKYEISYYSVYPFLLLVYFLPLILKIFDRRIGKFKIEKKVIFTLLYFSVIFLNLFYYKSTDYFLSSFKLIFSSLVAAYFANLKVSLKLLKKYIKYFLILHLIILLYVLINKELYDNMRMDYMVFGYDCLFITMFFGYFYKETLKLKYLFLLIFGNILLFMFGSRFTFLLGSIGTLIFLYRSKKKWIRFLIFLGMILLPIIYFNLEFILKSVIIVFNRYNISIESVERLAESLDNFNAGGGILADRLIWYRETFEIIKENLLFGVGILGYDGKISNMLYNGDGTFYPHNIFLEILLHFGIFGFLIFILVIILIFRNVYINKKQGKQLESIEIVFIIMSLGLLLSSSYLRSIWFYFAILIPFNKSYYKMK